MNIQFFVLFFEYCHRSTYIAWMNNYFLKSQMNTALMNNYLRIMDVVYYDIIFILDEFHFLKAKDCLLCINILPCINIV